MTCKEMWDAFVLEGKTYPRLSVIRVELGLERIAGDDLRDDTEVVTEQV